MLTPSEHQPDSRVDQLLKEKAELEKVRLFRMHRHPLMSASSPTPYQQVTKVLVNNEVSETSQQLLMQQLEEAKEAISRLTVSQARSSGWEVRLEAANRERDDMRQERDSEAQRAKAAEAHVAVLRERCGA